MLWFLAGALALPRRWASAASVNSSGSSSSTIGPSPHQDDSSLSSRSHSHSHKSLEQSLLTTCVGSIRMFQYVTKFKHDNACQLAISCHSIITITRRMRLGRLMNGSVVRELVNCTSHAGIVERILLCISIAPVG